MWMQISQNVKNKARKKFNPIVNTLRVIYIQALLKGPNMKKIVISFICLCISLNSFAVVGTGVNQGKSESTCHPLDNFAVLVASQEKLQETRQKFPNYQLRKIRILDACWGPINFAKVIVELTPVGKPKECVTDSFMMGYGEQFMPLANQSGRTIEPVPVPNVDPPENCEIVKYEPHVTGSTGFSVGNQ